MAHLLCFSRCRTTAVEELSPQRLRSTCHLVDHRLEARVWIEVPLPGLEIEAVGCRLERGLEEVAEQAQARLQKVRGVRVGPGLRKILPGLIGRRPPWDELAYMVEECCQGVILTLTRRELARAPLQPEDSREHFAEMVRKNIRLYNRCAAFAPGSSLVEGLEPPQADGSA